MRLFGPDASDELEQTAAHHENRRAGLGNRFLDTVDALLDDALA